MAEENNTGSIAAAVAAEDEKTSAAKKKRSPRRRKAAAESGRAVSEAPAAKPRRYSEQERKEKLRLIETQVAECNGTLKNAIKSAGISEQTYYLWKRTVKRLSTGPRSLFPPAKSWRISFGSKKKTRGSASFWRKSCERKMPNCARGLGWINHDRNARLAINLNSLPVSHQCRQNIALPFPCRHLAKGKRVGA